MRLYEVLFSQGFGSRRLCYGLISNGLVRIDGVTCSDPAAEFDPSNLVFEVQNEKWRYQGKAYLVLHKPAGYETSQRPSAWPSIYTLLPAPLRQRPNKGGTPGVQAIGRLDHDTTGLLLFSDDGAFIHRMASPKHHVPKEYQVETADAIDAKQVRRLLEGVVLVDDPKPVRAAACIPTGSHSLALTLTEGKYHQVKRMLAAVGNRVVRLHRSRIGRLELPTDLGPGEWRWLTKDELERAADR